MIPGNSIETPSRTKIPTTAQTTPSRPDAPPTIDRRSIALLSPPRDATAFDRRLLGIAHPPDQEYQADELHDQEPDEGGVPQAGERVPQDEQDHRRQECAAHPPVHEPLG